MKYVIRVVLAAVGIAVGVLAVASLREATLSTHQPVAPDSRIEVVVSADSKRGSGGQRLDEMVQAQLLTCRLVVSSDLVGAIEDQGDGRHFRAVLQPSMDQTNRRQFRGCLEDWLIDDFQLDVIRLAEIGNSD